MNVLTLRDNEDMNGGLTSHVDSPTLTTSITRAFTFEASHQLPWHQGTCANLHGHSYRLEVTVIGPLTENGIVTDFADLRRTVTTHVLDDYDHAHLNELVPNPTAELVANDIVRRLLAARLPVTSVTLHETAKCSTTVYVTGV